MKHRITPAAIAAALVAVLATAVPLSAQDAGDLATRCESVPFTGTGGDGADLLPATLSAIGVELRARGPDALADIEAGLAKSANLRRLAPFVVNEWPCDRTRTLLVGLLEDRDDFTAFSAAFALGEVRGKEVVDPLLAAATKRPGMVRHNVLNALGDLGALAKGLDLALSSTGDSEAWVRHSAYSCLGEVDWPKGIEQALAALEEAAGFEDDADAKAAAERSLRVLRARK